MYMYLLCDTIVCTGNTNIVSAAGRLAVWPAVGDFCALPRLEPSISSNLQP